MDRLLQALAPQPGQKALAIAAPYAAAVLEHVGLSVERLEEGDLTTAPGKAYDVIKEKNMYGRKSMGIERATYLIDATGKIAQIWRKVKVPGHVEAVLEAAQTL